eukprot:m.8565 g.8565  ORF g.8565 m.8565 type:complete len:581 (-) comp3258_c0_seq1:43-1785(-)
MARSGNDHTSAAVTSAVGHGATASSGQSAAPAPDSAVRSDVLPSRNTGAPTAATAIPPARPGQGASPQSPTSASPSPSPSVGAPLPDPRDTQDAAVARLLDRYSARTEIRGKKLRVVQVPTKGEMDPSTPTLFFFHGFGGSVLHWSAQLTFFKSRVPIVAVDMVGHGDSEVVQDVAAYDCGSLVSDLCEVYRRHRTKNNVVLAHSYGCSLATFMLQQLEQTDPAAAASLSAFVLIGLTLETPTATAPAWLPYLPVWGWDLLRYWRTRGGADSVSVKAFVSPSASRHVRERQLQFNQATPSLVVKHMLSGVRRATEADYGRITVPTLFVCGQDDHVTPVSSTYKVYHVVSRPHGPHIIPNAGHSVMTESSELLNALVSSFLIKKCGCATLKIEPSPGRLRNFAHAPKWCVKNHAKWKVTQNASRPCGKQGAWADHGGLIACKVLREDDEEHSPQEFLARNPSVGLVIDISRETPPYLPSSLGDAKYVKVATQSKVVPDPERVEEFFKVANEFWSHPENKEKDIAVHCHYGSNRTGFMICAYICAARGYPVDAALDEFAEVRPPGIKHLHFKEDLRARFPDA